MKVGVIEKSGVLKILERDKPEIQSETDVLFKVKRVGICGSDIHIYHGKNPFATYPRVWGHEVVGEVVAVGGAVTSVKKGDHVVLEPILSCHTCYSCRHGRLNACEQLRVFGVHVDGGCQEYLCVSEANVHLIPSDVPWDFAALIEPFTIGAQACYRGKVEKDDFVFIMGAGTIGLTIAVNAKIAGAVVIISDIVDEKLQYAKSLGVDFCINAKECDVLEKVREITGGPGSNVTIDAVCSKKSFEDAVAITAAGGRIVELSFNETPSEIVPVNIVKKELDIYGTRHQTRRFPVVIEYLKQGKLPVKGFVTKVFPIEQMVEAFEFTDKNNASVRKVLISFD